MATMTKIGLGFIVLGMVLMVREHVIIRGSAIVDGEVVAKTAGGFQNTGSRSSIPTIRFTTPEGREVVFKPSAGLSEQGVEAGDRVRVAYDPQEPSRARLLTFGYRFGFAYCLIGLGLWIIFIGYGFRHGNAWMHKTYPMQEPAGPSGT
jgi:hypothetical protein